MIGKVVSWRLERTVSQDLVDLAVAAGALVEVVGVALAADLVVAEALLDAVEALEAAMVEDAGEELLVPAAAALVGVMVEVTIPLCRLTSSPITPLVGVNAVRQFTSAISRGLPAMMTWSSCLIRLERSNVLRFSTSLTEDPGVRV
jgi:hypothetical protein